MADINYTFIIPHKNIPDLLCRCLASIPRREDIQIIVVDDNSDPEKVDFDHFPGVGEPCVEIYFTKEGKGAGYARNVGLGHAQGKWLLFADADDYFTSEIEKLLNDYKNSKSDIVYFNSKSQNIVNPSTNFGDQINYVLSGNSDENLENYLRYQNGVPWGKMLKKSLVEKNNIMFDEIPKHNDTMFSLKIGYHATLISVDKRICYINYCRYDSISNNNNYSETLHSTIRVSIAYYKFAIKHRIEGFNRWIIFYRFREAYRNKCLLKAMSYIKINDLISKDLFIDFTKFVSHYTKKYLGLYSHNKVFKDRI